MRTQVTFDCADPHAQAAFWTQVLGGVVEDHSALVEQLIAGGRMPAEDRIVVNGRSAAASRIRTTPVISCFTGWVASSPAHAISRPNRPRCSQARRVRLVRG